MLSNFTIVATIFLINVSGSFLLIITWLWLRKKFKGLNFIVIDHLIRSFGLGLLLFRGRIPDFFSIVIANLCLFSGFSFLLIGLEQLFNKKSSIRTGILLNSTLLALLLLFTYKYPSLTGRVIAMYSVGVVLCMQLFYLLTKRVPLHYRIITRPVSIVFMVFALTSLARVAIAIYEKKEGNFFSISSIGISMTLIYSVLFFLATISVLFLLIFMLYYEILQNEKNLKELVKKRTEQLVQAEKLTTLGTLSAGVAHEINNPNNFILMNAEMLSKGCNMIQKMLTNNNNDGVSAQIGKMSALEFVNRMPQIANDINDGAKRIEHIVNDLREYSRPSIASDIVFDLNDAVFTAVNFNKASLQKYTKKFSISLCSEKTMVHGDKQKIVQAIINLLQNAAQALTNEDQGVIICTGIVPEKQRVFVEVTDEGKGIPEEIQHQIIEPFFTTRRSEGGTGLGLWTVYHIVNEHNGNLQFKSSPGHGTTVRVELISEGIV